jgi:gluconolactonase
MRSCGPFLAVLLLASPASAQDMPLSQILIPGEGWHPVPVEVRSFGGIAGSPKGEIYVADPESRKIISLLPTGVEDAPRVEISASGHGLCFGPEGKLYASEPGRKRLLVFGTEREGKARVLDVGVAADDLAVTRGGTVYCTVPKEKAIYRIGKDGKAVKAAGDIDGPSGLTLWPNQGTLVVGTRGDHLIAFRVEKDGRLTYPEPYYRLRTRAGEEDARVRSLTVDEAGRLYAATREGVQVFDPTGRMSGVLSRPAREPVTGVAFGGPDRNQLFIVCGGKVYYRNLRAHGAVEGGGR